MVNLRNIVKAQDMIGECGAREHISPDCNSYEIQDFTFKLH